jgi:hypothetical protein
MLLVGDKPPMSIASERRPEDRARADIDGLLTAAGWLIQNRNSINIENKMNVKLSIVLAACLALFVSACGPSPQSLILGKWEVESAIKMTAQFGRDGTASINMLGQTLHGRYKLNAENELEWTMNGITSKSKANVTATELELTDAANRTIKYKRK